jgi:CubicO group peptidase (beta-lactamase class C family)
MKSSFWLISLALFLPYQASSQELSPDILSSKVDSYVRPYLAGNNFSGSILIAAHGRVLFEKAYGMANYELSVPNSLHARFHVASVSKSFTAAAILLLQQRGLLSVNDPLTRFVPGYPAGEKITIHHLLTHTSGIPNVNNFPEYQDLSRRRLSLVEIIHLFNNKPLDFPPGARFSYSNSNYNLLAFIIEKVSGKSYGEFLRQNIFVPLGMNLTGNDDGSGDLILERASGYVPVRMRDLENAPYLNWSIKTGNGSLYSTVDDLYRWDRALYGDKLLDKNSRDKMFTDYGGFGYGWFVRKHFNRRVTVINGRSPGFTSSLERFVDDDTCIILATNTYSGLTQSMADDIAAIVFDQKYEAPGPPVEVSPALLDSYVGKYKFAQDFVYNPGAQVVIERTGDGLRLTSAGTVSYLIPQSNNIFKDRLYGGTVTFDGSPGKIEQLKWNFGREFVARREVQP